MTLWITVFFHTTYKAEFSENTIKWFANYLTGRTQAVQSEGYTSEVLQIHKEVPQGSVLGTLLFIIYINCLGQNVPSVNFHFYADDTVIYCSAPTSALAFGNLQHAFEQVQDQLRQLQLVLNVEKTKLMLFSSSRMTKGTLSEKIVNNDGQEIFF